jgi:hypothetical protein
MNVHVIMNKETVKFEELMTITGFLER